MADKLSKRINKLPANGKKTISLVPLILMGIFILALVNYQAALFVAAGIVPTLVLASTASGIYKSEKIQCVAFCNLAALVPFVIELFDNPNVFPGIIYEIIPVVTVYVGAAIGYGLLFIGPMIAATIIQALSAERISRLMSKRQALLDQWGGELITGGASSASQPPKK